MATPTAIRKTTSRRQSRVWAECLTVCAVLALLTYGGFVLEANPLTIGFLYLLVVSAVASFFGFWQASITSILAVVLLDYYFEPPVFSFEVSSPGGFIALVTFELTALPFRRFYGREKRGTKK